MCSCIKPFGISYDHPGESSRSSAVFWYDSGMNKRATKVAKVAISLPPHVLRIVDKECKARGESRSQFFRHAVEALLRQTNEQKAVQKYIQGYREQPETQAEIETANQTSQAVLSQEPWE